jgi:hypothetical protein
VKAFFCKTWEDWYTSLNSVESLDNILEIIKGMRGSPSVEFPDNLCEEKDFEGKAYRKSVVEEY